MHFVHTHLVDRINISSSSNMPILNSNGISSGLSNLDRAFSGAEGIEITAIEDNGQSHVMEPGAAGAWFNEETNEYE